MSVARAREAAVLGILAAHPAYGYQIAAALDHGGMQLVGLKRSAVYAVLERLKAKGYITETRHAAGAYPDQLICEITEVGRKALSEMIPDLGGLPVVPLMSLTMLHDSGVDIRAALPAQIAQRDAILREMESDEAHSTSATHKLAKALLQAERNVLESLC